MFCIAFLGAVPSPTIAMRNGSGSHCGEYGTTVFTFFIFGLYAVFQKTFTTTKTPRRAVVRQRHKLVVAGNTGVLNALKQTEFIATGNCAETRLACPAVGALVFFLAVFALLEDGGAVSHVFFSFHDVLFSTASRCFGSIGLCLW
tara:strand:- start:47 stop:481 length:435 start_codon:yes stop_codon:yes gene_type:complete